MPLILIPFGVLAAGLFLLAYTHTASAHQGSTTKPASSGGILGALGLVLPVLAPLERGVKRAVDWAINNVRGWISHWALAHVKAVARWFVGLNLLLQRAAKEQSGLATDTADALQKMRQQVIPHAAQVAALPAIRQAKVATTKAETALSRERALSESFSTSHRAQVKLNVHYTHAIDVTLPRTIGGIRTREEALSRDQAKLKERTTSLENGAIRTFEWIRTHPLSAVTGVFAGAVAIALQRLGWGVLRCRSWQSLGRRLTCGMGSLLLDLLNGVIDVLLIADLCQITRLMIDAAESSVVQDALGGLIGGIDDLLLCQNVTRPTTWAVLSETAPSGQQYAALPVVG